MGVQLRYNFRLDPTPGQRIALAKAFGCARWVYNAALAVRKSSREAGEGWISGGLLSKRLITEAKKNPETAFLAEVSAVVLQQALRDNDVAYRNFFESAKGSRTGARVGESRLRSRRDNRQAIRFTANSRFKVTGSGRLSLPKIGDIEVRWSRALPSVPSSVTVIKDAAGRYFASFVIETDPAQDLDRFPDSDAVVGIDLGLASFAVLSDGTVIENPRILRRAERKLNKAQQSLARKQKGSNNRRKAVVKVAKAHAKVTDTRRDFHHKLSTQIIAENQGVYVEPRGGSACTQRPEVPREVRARRGLVHLREHAGLQSRAVRARLRESRPLGPRVTGLLGVRSLGRQEAARGPHVAVRRVRHGPRPGPQRGKERARPRAEGEPKRLWRRHKTRTRPGGCR